MHLEVIVALNDIESRVFPKDLTDRNYESNKKVHEVEKALEIPDQLLDRQIENQPNTNYEFSAKFNGFSSEINFAINTRTKHSSRYH